jgi:haloalkane dehalogenase
MTAPADLALNKLAVLDSVMAYREAGSPNSPTVLFLHGNPTSSYIWRNIIPLVEHVGHCIAPDLIGFGQSGKPSIEHRFFDHVRQPIQLLTFLLSKFATSRQGSCINAANY